jgi:hypothetical protein
MSPISPGDHQTLNRAAKTAKNPETQEKLRVRWQLRGAI